MQNELNRVEDLLAASRAERDEIGIKYNALSERVSIFCKLLNARSCAFITGRNEVVAKVIFLHLFVILFTGGGSASMHAGIPPRSRPQQSRPPPPEQIPPHQAPPGPGTPPEQTPLPGEQTPAYGGVRAAGTHPTGMHSCLKKRTYNIRTLTSSPQIRITTYSDHIVYGMMQKFLVWLCGKLYKRFTITFGFKDFVFRLMKHFEIDLEFYY